MTHVDNVFNMLVEANPIPEIEKLDLADLGGPEYLATLEQRSSEMTQVDRRQETPRRGPRRRLAIGLAAAAAVVLSAAVLLLALNDDEPVAATTTTPSESSALEVSGQGSQNSHTLELSGSYSVETTVTGDCSYTFELSRSGTGHLVSAITSIADPGTTTVTLNDISSGNYFVTVQTDTEFSCPWTMEFTR